MDNSFQQILLYLFDTNKDGKIDADEILYALFFAAAMFLLFYIVLTNLDVLIIFKYSKLFILFFALLACYSVFRVLYLNKKKPSEFTPGEKIMYIFNIIIILVSSFAVIYLSRLFA